MSILLFFIVLFTLVLVHEWGHYIVAKWSDMRVDEFGIGFPPKLFGIKKGETEYTFNALPIGGFVRIFGEDPTQADSDSARAFSSKSRFKQALVLLAGVTMNIFFAWLLFIIIFSVGIPTAVSEENASDEAQVRVAEVLPEGPAADVLPAGATISGITIDNTSHTDLVPSEIVTLVETADGAPITVQYSVGGEAGEVTITPETGVIAENPEQAAIGVSFTLIENVSYSIPQAVWEATVHTGQSLINIVVGLSNLIYGTFTGTADLDAVAGPVGIVNLVGEAAQFGLTSLLLFTAVISLNLAIINLLPFPALDGGRLLFVGIEAITRKPINPIWVSRLNALGFGLLMLLMIVITYNDIVRLL